MTHRSLLAVLGITLLISLAGCSLPAFGQSGPGWSGVHIENNAATTEHVSVTITSENNTSQLNTSLPPSAEVRLTDVFTHTGEYYVAIEREGSDPVTFPTAVGRNADGDVLGERVRVEITGEGRFVVSYGGSD